MSEYFIRGTATALAEFLLIYCAARAAAGGGWRLWSRKPERGARIETPNVLLAIQLSPFALALTGVMAFAVPAFLRLEPYSGDEKLGWPVAVLGLSCAVLITASIWRAAVALKQTRWTTRSWEVRATGIGQRGGIRVIGALADAPPLAVAGFFRPKLYLSELAATRLSEAELALAIAHEKAHVERRDNLKKLMLRTCCVPSIPPLERRWAELLELAADGQAVGSRAQALDLASALVKASKLEAVRAPELAMTFTGEGADLLRTRIERLLCWQGRELRRSRGGFCVIAAAMAIIVLTIPFYSTLLWSVHQFSELIMR